MQVSQARPTAARHGLSLIELLCSLTIALLLLGSALPALSDLRSSQALLATAALLETDLHHARSLAMASGQAVRLSLQVLPDGRSCYAVHTGPANACRCDGQGQARCEADASLLRLEEQTASRGPRIGPVSRSIAFDGDHGTVTPTATLKVSAADGRSVHQVINIMGRVRSCTPNGPLGGIKPCV
jgi:type IV fimbrial biogenesis protein FimT